MLIQTAAHAHTLSDRWQSLTKQKTKSVCTVTVSALHRHTVKYENPNIHPPWSLAHYSYAFTSMSELLVCTDDNECKNFSYRQSRVLPNTFCRLASPLFSLKSLHAICMPQPDPNLPPPMPTPHITGERTLQSSALLSAWGDLQILSLINIYLSDPVNFMHFWKTGRSL